MSWQDPNTGAWHPAGQIGDSQGYDSKGRADRETHDAEVAQHQKSMQEWQDRQRAEEAKKAEEAQRKSHEWQEAQRKSGEQEDARRRRRAVDPNSVSWAQVVVGRPGPLGCVRASVAMLVIIVVLYLLLR